MHYYVLSVLVHVSCNSGSSANVRHFSMTLVKLFSLLPYLSGCVLRKYIFEIRVPIVRVPRIRHKIVMNSSEPMILGERVEKFT